MEKIRYACVDYTNQSLEFVADTLEEIKEILIEEAIENESDPEEIESIRELSVDENEIRWWLKDQRSLTLHKYIKDNE